jgi:hypothetical protein
MSGESAYLPFLQELTVSKSKAAKAQNPIIFFFFMAIFVAKIEFIQISRQNSYLCCINLLR